MKVLNVCLGNICRSPMAEGILAHLASENGLDWQVDSAGTSSWHIGELPDRRAINTCRDKGIDITYQRARQLSASDFDEYDLILAMDQSNLTDIKDLLSKSNASPETGLITDLAGVSFHGIPDPYYDGRFSEVFDLLWEACGQIIEKYR